MKFTLEINMDNDAFVDQWDVELGEIIRKVGNRLLAHYPGATVYDVNGNPVGQWKVEEDREEQDHELLHIYSDPSSRDYQVFMGNKCISRGFMTLEGVESYVAELEAGG